MVLTYNLLITCANFLFKAQGVRPIRERVNSGGILKMLNYLAWQIETAKKDANSSHYDLYSIVTVWRDYLSECKQLSYDLTHDSIYFPPDLIKQHNRTMKLIKIKEDELSRKKAAARLEKLRWMAYKKRWFDDSTGRECKRSS